MTSNIYSLGMVIIQLIALISLTLYMLTSKQSVVVYIGTITALSLLLFTDFLILRFYKLANKST